MNAVELSHRVQYKLNTLSRNRYGSYRLFCVLYNTFRNPKAYVAKFGELPLAPRDESRYPSVSLPVDTAPLKRHSTSEDPSPAMSPANGFVESGLLAFAVSCAAVHVEYADKSSTSCGGPKVTHADLSDRPLAKSVRGISVVVDARRLRHVIVTGSRNCRSASAHGESDGR